MDNYLLEIIKKTTDYIESNILEELSLDSISENVNLSKYHLLRIWKGATSTGLMEYVRRRRIALSLSDLINSKNSIEFISSKYGFEWERTYNRVFKEEYNITPAKWRKNPIPVKILDRFNADFMNVAGDSLLFFRSIVVLPSFSIAGMDYKLRFEENETAGSLAVDFFYKQRPAIINPVEKDIYIGYTSVRKPFKGYFDYIPSIKVDHNSIVMPPLQVRKIPAHKYGVFTYMGPHRPEDLSYKFLEPILRYIRKVWMPTMQFDLKVHFHFQQLNYAKCNKHYCECDIYYPISTL